MEVIEVPGGGGLEAAGSEAAEPVTLHLVTEPRVLPL
jgi:hypothetical protein